MVRESSGFRWHSGGNGSMLTLNGLIPFGSDTLKLASALMEVIVPKSKTPFAPLWTDRYPTEKSGDS